MAQSKETVLQADTEKLREEFDALRRDVRALTRDLKSFAEHQTSALGERAGDSVVELKAATDRQLELAKRYAAEATKAAENTVREHPGYVLAGAAALGFLVGALALRRH